MVPGLFMFFIISCTEWSGVVDKAIFLTAAIVLNVCSTLNTSMISYAQQHQAAMKEHFSVKGKYLEAVLVLSSLPKHNIYYPSRSSELYYSESNSSYPMKK